MRVCYLSDERFPSTHTDTQQVALNLEALSGAGVTITLIVPRMTKGPHAGGQEAALRRFYGVGDGFDVRFVRTVDPERREIVKALHPVAALREAGKLKPDLIYTRNVQIALLAIAAGHRVAFESYRIVDRGLRRLAAQIARASRSPRVLGIITHSEVSRRSFLRLGVPEDKVAVIYNGVPERHLEPRLERAAARAHCGLSPEATVAVFAGHIRDKKGLESLAEVAAATPAIEHVWVGGDNEGSPAWGRRCAADAGAGNVSVTGWLTAPEVAPYLYAADALVIPPASEPLQRHGNTVLPMKLFGYLGAGRAIVAPSLPDLGELLTHDENAWLFAEDDVKAGAAALERVTTDDALQQRLGQAARRTAEDLTWSKRGARIRAFLEERLAAAR